MPEQQNAVWQNPLLWGLVNAVEKLDAVAVREWLVRGAEAAPADKLMANRRGSMTEDMMTSLGYASRHGRIEIVTLLLDAGADINFKDRRGFTPLMWAVENYARAPTIPFLIIRGASLDEKNEAGKTVWDLAKTHEHMVERLQEAVEERQRLVAEAAVAQAAAKKAARDSAFHDTAVSRQEGLKPRRHKFTIKP